MFITILYWQPAIKMYTLRFVSVVSLSLLQLVLVRCQTRWRCHANLSACRFSPHIQSKCCSCVKWCLLSWRRHPPHTSRILAAETQTLKQMWSDWDLRGRKQKNQCFIWPVSVYVRCKWVRVNVSKRVRTLECSDELWLYAVCIVFICLYVGQSRSFFFFIIVVVDWCIIWSKAHLSREPFRLRSHTWTCVIWAFEAGRWCLTLWL